MADDSIYTMSAKLPYRIQIHYDVYFITKKSMLDMEEFPSVMVYIFIVCL